MTREKLVHDYQCVLVGDVWHATQEQAAPPQLLRMGAWTICCVWAEFKRGFERRRPTCPECLRACVEHEAGVRLEARSTSSGSPREKR